MPLLKKSIVTEWFESKYPKPTPPQAQAWPIIVLPAFSHFAAEVEVGKYPFMSPLARSVTFTEAVAVKGDRLMPIALE